MPTVTVIQPTITEEKAAKIHCAAYCRVSSDSEDQLNSFMAQTRYYSRIFENSQTEELIDIYADEGVTGTRDDKRSEFQRLMKDCRKGKIDRSKNSPILPFSTAFLALVKPSKINGFRAFRRMQLHIHNFTNWFYRVQIVHGFRNKNSRQSTPSTLSAVRLTSVRISTGATAITVYSPYTTTCYTYYTIHFLLCQSFSFLLL